MLAIVKRNVLFRTLARSFIPTKLHGYLMKPWIMAQSTPVKPFPIEAFAVYAVIGTWMEADIIEATVSNAFAQGADRVFIIDNASPDDTVSRAKKAGAEHVLTYKTDQYDERYRTRLMREFICHASETSHAEHIWWLWLDADEFPRPLTGGTLRSMLQGLDSKFRVIGARYLNHYPSPHKTPYRVGRHPIDFQPLCEELKSSMCLQGHRKHPLIRWDRRGPQILPGEGCHVAYSETRPLLEPLEPIIIHHFPFRDEQVTRLRMQALWSCKNADCSRAREDDVAVTHMKARFESLDAVYKGDWANVTSLHFEELRRGISLTDWREFTTRISSDLTRWYASAP